MQPDVNMSRSYDWKLILSIILVVMAFFGLTSCGGGSSSPRSGNQVMIMPPSSQNRPELAVVSPSVNNATPVVGASFILSAAVRNDGSEESPSTTLRFYRSTDATITTSDAAIGTRAVAVLASSGSRSESVDLTAPSSPGTYYYGACVDAVAGESDTTNNCSASVEVTVLETSPQTIGQPDLEVGTPTVDDANPEPGAAFTLSVPVSNTGAGESPLTTLRYYRSTDATITTSDMPVGTDDVGVLSASGTSSESIPLTAPSMSGVYYYGACVDSVTNESDTSNNCSASVSVQVTALAEPENPLLVVAPDLVVGTPTVDESSPAPGGAITLSVAVRNDGSEESPSTTLRYYRSTDATITTSDMPVGTDDVGVLSASGSRSKSVDLAAPSSLGTYYYGACVDAVAGESDTTNNCSASVEVTVLATSIQEEEQTSATLTISPSSASLVVGETITLSATVTDTSGAEISLAEGLNSGLPVFWSTSDSNVATVSGTVIVISTDPDLLIVGATATVTAISAGAVTITAKTEGNVVDTASITVTN